LTSDYDIAFRHPDTMRPNLRSLAGEPSAIPDLNKACAVKKVVIGDQTLIAEPHRARIAFLDVSRVTDPVAATEGVAGADLGSCSNHDAYGSDKAIKASNLDFVSDYQLIDLDPAAETKADALADLHTAHCPQRGDTDRIERRKASDEGENK
jgi:hypothetical protein